MSAIYENLDPSDLWTALALESREHLALVGGGGKTTLMSALAGVARKAGKRVLATTTTKLWHHEALSSPPVIFVQSGVSWKKDLMEDLRTQGHAFLAEKVLASGKVQGISPFLADDLFQKEIVDYLIVEADGAAGRPVKAHADHEPVIPASATKVVALLGLEALGRPLFSETVFREDLFSALTGCDPGETLSPAVLFKLISNPQGIFKGAPACAKKVVFLNKADLLARDHLASELVDLLLSDQTREFYRVIIGALAKDQYFIARRRDGGYFPKDR